MKEYEHMLIALDEYISHNVAAVICIENYHGKSIPKAFRNIFDVFSLYRKDYEENAERYRKGNIEDKIQFQMQCRENKEEMLKWFIKELEKINSDIDYKQVVAEYLGDLDNEDIQTPEMYLDIYPMLISLIRKKEEEVKAND